MPVSALNHAGKARRMPDSRADDTFAIATRNGVHSIAAQARAAHYPWRTGRTKQGN